MAGSAAKVREAATGERRSAPARLWSKGLEAAHH